MGRKEANGYRYLLSPSSLCKQTPLFYAVSHCQAGQLVPILLKAGAHVNKQRKGDGWTPLFVAAMLGRLDIATLLLQAGADTRVEDEEERTAEAIAHQYGHHMVADTINRYAKKSEISSIIALAFFILLV